jgi:hypothetical protein
MIFGIVHTLPFQISESSLKPNSLVAKAIPKFYDKDVYNRRIQRIIK